MPPALASPWNPDHDDCGHGSNTSSYTGSDSGSDSGGHTEHDEESLLESVISSHIPLRLLESLNFQIKLTHLNGVQGSEGEFEDYGGSDWDEEGFDESEEDRDGDEEKSVSSPRATDNSTHYQVYFDFASEFQKKHYPRGFPAHIDLEVVCEILLRSPPPSTPEFWYHKLCYSFKPSVSALLDLKTRAKLRRWDDKDRLGRRRLNFELVPTAEAILAMEILTFIKRFHLPPGQAAAGCRIGVSGWQNLELDWLLEDPATRVIPAFWQGWDDAAQDRSRVWRRGEGEPPIPGLDLLKELSADAIARRVHAGDRQDRGFHRSLLSSPRNLLKRLRSKIRQKATRPRDVCDRLSSPRASSHQRRSAASLTKLDILEAQMADQKTQMAALEARVTELEEALRAIYDNYDDEIAVRSQTPQAEQHEMQEHHQMDRGRSRDTRSYSEEFSQSDGEGGALVRPHRYAWEHPQ